MNVKKIISTNPKNKKISTCDNYDVLKNNAFHDRFVIVDDSCYHFGASLEELGKSVSAGHRISDKIVIDFIKEVAFK